MMLKLILMMHSTNRPFQLYAILLVYYKHHEYDDNHNDNDHNDDNIHDNNWDNV